MAWIDREDSQQYGEEIIIIDPIAGRISAEKPAKEAIRGHP
jgi:hypothetical protein